MSKAVDQTKMDVVRKRCKLFPQTHEKTSSTIAVIGIALINVSQMQDGSLKISDNTTKTKIAISHTNPTDNKLILIILRFVIAFFLFGIT